MGDFLFHVADGGKTSQSTRNNMNFSYNGFGCLMVVVFDFLFDGKQGFLAK